MIAEVSAEEEVSVGYPIAQQEIIGHAVNNEFAAPSQIVPSDLIAEAAKNKTLRPTRQGKMVPRWTNEEEAVLMRAIGGVDPKGRWHEIAAQLGEERSAMAVEQHWQVMVGKRKKHQSVKLQRAVDGQGGSITSLSLASGNGVDGVVALDGSAVVASADGGDGVPDGGKVCVAAAPCAMRARRVRASHAWGTAPFSGTPPPPPLLLFAHFFLSHPYSPPCRPGVRLR